MNSNSNCSLIWEKDSSGKYTFNDNDLCEAHLVSGNKVKDVEYDVQFLHENPDEIYTEDTSKSMVQKSISS